MNQYYRVHAVIDLDAICHNIREVKRVVGEGVKDTDTEQFQLQKN